MVGMTGEERKVANFLTEKKFKLKFQPSVSVYDLGDRYRTFYPDFLLTDLGIYIEVCGAERNEDYERRDKIYKKNEISIIFVETYKDEGKWQHYLIRKINEIHEKRKSAVSTITPSKQVSDKPKNEKMLDEITAHLNKISKEVKQEEFSSKEFKDKEPSKEVNSKSKLISQQSQIGIMLSVGGICLIILTIFIVFLNIILAFIFSITRASFILISAAISPSSVFSTAFIEATGSTAATSISLLSSS